MTKECERCSTNLEKDMKSPRRPVPVRYGETDMVICYQCAVELTLLIGHWLGTEPMDDPVEWFMSLQKG